MDKFRELVGFRDPEKVLSFLQQFKLIAQKDLAQLVRLLQECRKSSTLKMGKNGNVPVE